MFIPERQPYAGMSTGELVEGIREALHGNPCPELDELERRIDFSDEIKDIKLTGAELTVYQTVRSFYPGIAPKSAIIKALRASGLKGSESAMWVHKRRLLQKVQAVMRCDVRSVNGMGYRWFTEEELLQEKEASE